MGTKIKCKNMMYVQKWSHRPGGIESAKDLADRIEAELHPARYAVIVHGKETDNDGNPKEPDIHAMMCFANARYLDAVAKKLGDEAQYIQKWDGDANNGFSYLLHRTSDARKKGKHQYDPSEVAANFDFAGLLQQIENKVNLKQYKAQDGVNFSIDELLNALYVGIMSKDEVEKRMTGAQYGRYRRQVEDVWAKRLRNLADEWRKEMIVQGKQLTVIWLYGEAGAGKTHMARTLAEKANQPYFMAGSSRDTFQNYSGEHTIILDEMRPKVMAYQDLLRILDPFSIRTGVNAPARYTDKALAADLIIVTSPYSPYEFWLEQFSTLVKYNFDVRRASLAEEGEDDFDQLDRRIGVTIRLEQDFVYQMKSNEREVGHYEIVSLRTPNPYSGQNNPTSAPDSSELFISLFE